MTAPVEPGPGRPLTERAFGPDRPPGPVVRLPTWVNVVLVLILLASCGAANKDVAFPPLPDQSEIATRDDVRDLCQLLGAVAEKQGLEPDEVVADTGMPSACREGLQR